jgi:cyclin-dependent kinase 12/13
MKQTVRIRDIKANLKLPLCFQIGQGTYSNVYKARDLETGKIVALKKVRFDNLEPESVRFMAREIQVLRRLDHPNIIKLEGLVTSRMSCSLYLVFEYMEHDLAGLASSPGIKFSEPQVYNYGLKCFACSVYNTYVTYFKVF